MFLVGGGIIVHSFSWLSEQFHHLEHWVSQYLGAVSEITLPILLDGITGVIVGAMVLVAVNLVSRLKNRQVTSK